MSCFDLILSGHEVEDVWIVLSSLDCRSLVPVCRYKVGICAIQPDFTGFVRVLYIYGTAGNDLERSRRVGQDRQRQTSGGTIAKINLGVIADAADTIHGTIVHQHHGKSAAALIHLRHQRGTGRTTDAHIFFQRFAEEEDAVGDILSEIHLRLIHIAADNQVLPLG